MTRHLVDEWAQIDRNVGCMKVKGEGADFPQKPAMNGARGPRCAGALLSMTTSGLAPYLSGGHASTKYNK